MFYKNMGQLKSDLPSAGVMLQEWLSPAVSKKSDTIINFFNKSQYLSYINFTLFNPSKTITPEV